jgi:hypothetical protein
MRVMAEAAKLRGDVRVRALAFKDGAGRLPAVTRLSLTKKLAAQ